MRARTRPTSVPIGTQPPTSGSHSVRPLSLSQTRTCGVAAVRDMIDALADGIDGEGAAAAREIAARLDAVSGRLTLSTVPAEHAAHDLRRTVEAVVARIRDLELERRNLETLNVVATML